MQHNTRALEHRQLLAVFMQALQTDPLFRIEIARAVMNTLSHLDYVSPLFDLQTLPMLIPCKSVARINYHLYRFKEYFNKPLYRVVFTKVGTRQLSARRRVLTPEEVIHLRGLLLRPTSAWAIATRRDHKSKHPELYATKEQIKEQQATNTGRYAYRRNRAARVTSIVINPSEA